MKKLFTFFAIAMMAITASAKVYEVNLQLSSEMYLWDGDSQVIDGVKFTVLSGNISTAETGLDFIGTAGENSFQISTEDEETISRIEVVAGFCSLKGTGWTQTASGAVWTGSATSVTFGQMFSGATKVTVTTGEETALENTTATVQAQKIIENGQVVIIRDGVRYNAVGAKL